MRDISYRQTKAGRNRRKQGGAKDREEGRDGITQRRRRKRKLPHLYQDFFSFPIKVSGTETTQCRDPEDARFTHEYPERYQWYMYNLSFR